MNQSEIQTQIQSVTVYTDRALVTRSGKTALVGGVQELIVSHLPNTLETESLRASGRGEVGVKIIGVEVRERLLLKPANQSEREVQSELEAAQDAGKAIFDAIARLESRTATVKELATRAAARFAHTLSQSETNFENTTGLLDWVAAQLAQSDAERAALELQKRENAALQMAISSRLKQFQSNKRASERVVAVILEAQAAGNWELEISYVVNGASWKPLYDARALTKSAEAKFVLSSSALITQRSGENWENVALSLSTARPGLGTLPPKLEPLWIDVPRPAMAAAAPMMTKARMMRSDTGVNGMLEGLDQVAAMPAPEPIEAQDVVAEVSGEGATVEISLTYRLSVPSDGAPHRAAIAVREFPAQFDYVCLPRRIEVAYLRATATNNSLFALLEGEVSIFRDGTFMGKSRLKHTPQGAEFNLFLGPDEQVRAKRELTLRETDKNLIGNLRRVHFAYEIKLENLKGYPIKVAVQDQIPVSRSENIKVKLRGSTPETAQGDLGLLDWNISLNPGEKRVVRFDFGVESPRDGQIVGLAD